MRRYEDLYHRPGILDDSSTGMEWMESDYDNSTLQEVMENCTIHDFLNQFMILCQISTPNATNLAHSLGKFKLIDSNLESNDVYNVHIDKISISIDSNEKAYTNETSRIDIIIASDCCPVDNFRSLIEGHHFKMENESTFKTLPKVIKRLPLEEDVKLHIEFVVLGECISSLSFCYEP